MAYRTPEWDEPVTITKGDLFQLVSCAMNYDTRLPYGIVGPPFWKLLTSDMQADINRRADDASRTAPTGPA